MVVDALFTERVQAGQALGAAVRVEADLTDEKLIMDLLRKSNAAAAAGRYRRRHGGTTCA